MRSRHHDGTAGARVYRWSWKAWGVWFLVAALSDVLQSILNGEGFRVSPAELLVCGLYGATAIYLPWHILRRAAFSHRQGRPPAITGIGYVLGWAGLGVCVDTCLGLLWRVANIFADLPLSVGSVTSLDGSILIAAVTGLVGIGLLQRWSMSYWWPMILVAVAGVAYSHIVARMSAAGTARASTEVAERRALFGSEMRTVLPALFGSKPNESGLQAAMDAAGDSKKQPQGQQVLIGLAKKLKEKPGIECHILPGKEFPGEGNVWLMVMNSASQEVYPPLEALLLQHLPELSSGKTVLLKSDYERPEYLDLSDRGRELLNALLIRKGITGGYRDDVLYLFSPDIAISGREQVIAAGEAAAVKAAK